MNWMQWALCKVLSWISPTAPLRSAFRLYSDALRAKNIGHRTVFAGLGVSCLLGDEFSAENVLGRYRRLESGSWVYTEELTQQAMDDLRSLLIKQLRGGMRQPIG